MKREQRHGLWQAAAQCLLGGLGLALLTVACYRLVVVLVSFGGLLVPSALVAVMAFVCLDYFFTVSGLSEWLDLLASHR